MKKLLSILFTILGFSVVAQQDTSIHMPEVLILSQSPKANSVGNHTTTFEKEDLQKHQNRSLAELLTNASNVYVKSYGPGSLSTASIRGANAGQTLLTWQGIPLQSPLLGLLDINLIPINGFSQINLNKGGGSTMWGSGAVAASINLKQQNQFSKGHSFQLNTGAGSFGFSRNLFKAEINRLNLSANTSVSFEKSDNDFVFVPAPGLDPKTQTNAAYQNLNIMQHLGVKIGLHHIISFDAWLQQASKEIPPLLTQTSSVAYQDDQAIRIQLNWNIIKGAWVLDSKFGFFDEKQTYVDSAILLESPNNFKSYFYESTFKHDLNASTQLMIGFSNQLNQGEANLYHDDVQENRTALYGSFLTHQRNWRLQFALRGMAVDRQIQAPVPKFGFEWSKSKHFSLNGSLSRNFRYPSLNDRFWKPGGNIDLRPESGWSETVGLAYQMDARPYKVDLSLNVFNRSMKDWILWTPSSEGAFWSAFNIAEVWSRGFESSITGAYGSNYKKLEFKADYSFVKSTNEIAISIPKIAKGEQLIYTPIHNASVRLEYADRLNRFTYQHNFTGSTYGINEDLAAFSVANIFVERSFKLKACTIQGKFGVKNLWDTRYLIIERRPMMGRYYEISLNINYKK